MKSVVKQVSFLTIGILIVTLLLACDKEKGNDNGCDILSTEVTGVITINGENFCYDAGAFRYTSNDPTAVWSLYFIASGERMMHVVFNVDRREGIELDKTYNAFNLRESYFRDTEGNLLEMKSGTLTIKGSNYSNPSIYKYYGSVELVFKAIDGSDITIRGNYNFK